MPEPVVVVKTKTTIEADDGCVCTVQTLAFVVASTSLQIQYGPDEKFPELKLIVQTPVAALDALETQDPVWVFTVHVPAPIDKSAA